MFPLDVPDQGLSPEALLRSYEIEPLRKAGFTGKGQTVVVFSFDGVDQPDLDMFTTTFGLPPFTPEIVGGMPSQRSGEAAKGSVDVSGATVRALPASEARGKGPTDFALQIAAPGARSSCTRSRPQKQARAKAAEHSSSSPASPAQRTAPASASRRAGGGG
jgi:hypothetical protein